MADLRDFPPVEQNVERPPTIRQTLLGQFDKCPRSGYLSLRYGGGAPTHAQARGTAFHEVAERATRELMQTGEASYPPELARDLLEQVLKERTDLVIPVEEHESLRSMAWNWGKASGAVLKQREALVGIERKVMVEVDGWVLTGSLDLSFIEGNEGRIKDYKSGFSIPKQETFERQFQGQMYGLLQAEGRYVVEEMEDGTLVPGERVRGDQHLVGVHVHQLYPRHLYCARCLREEIVDEDSSKKECECESPLWVLDGRYAYYEAGDLANFKHSLSALLAKIEHGLETGDYPAVAGHHCGLCPAPQECPIPQEFRGGEIADLEQAMEVLSAADRMGAEATRLKGSVRAFAEAQELDAIPLAPDSDQEYGFTIVRSQPIKNKEKLREALANRVGDPDDFFSNRTSTKFDKRLRKEVGQ